MKQSLSLQIIAGMTVGLLCAHFFPHFIHYLSPLGTAFIMLMQMPVTLFVLCSIISGLGQLNLSDAKVLVWYSCIFLLGSWLITRLSTIVIPLAFPPSVTVNKLAHGETIYPSFKLSDAFIPENPFKSLAEGSVAAVVVFAVIFAIALLGVKKPEPFINIVRIVQEASIIIVNWIIKLSFFGVFCLSATTFKSIFESGIPEIRLYYYSFIFGTIFVSTLLIPLAITIVAPINFRQLMLPILPALLLSFVSGNVAITLPLVLQGLQQIMREHEFDQEKFMGFTSALVPLTFTFPISGKLFNVLFIYFASWYYGDQITGSEIFELSTLGLLTSFSFSPEGIGFLLEQVELPKNAVDLFLPTMQFTAKFAALAHVASIAAMCFFTVTSWEKRLVFKVRTLIITLSVALIGYALWFGIMRSLPIPATKANTHQKS